MSHAPIRSRNNRVLATVSLLLLAVAMAALPFHKAEALICGGEGNKPIHDPGWPKDAAELFNHTGRIAYWEGPPYGGGQWHAECQGNTRDFMAVLTAFAKLDIKTKRLVIHDGPDTSFWLNTSRNKDETKPPVPMDWQFMVWQQANWEHLSKMPGRMGAIVAGTTPENGPPTQLDVYPGGGITWADEKVPEGITVDDQRMEAHGFKPADGNVLEGTVIDLITKKPIAARISLQRVDPQKTGGYKHTSVAGTITDAKGHWVLTHTPDGWHRVVVEADGFVPHIIGYVTFSSPPRWHGLDNGLVPPGPVSGHVTDVEGKPLANVKVEFHDVVSSSGVPYESTTDYEVTTDADGRFSSNQLPIGTMSVWLHKDNYCRPGLGLPITTPKADIALTMTKSTQLIVTVDFKAGPRPKEYIVEINPEGGNVVGTWGGSATIDAKNQHTFTDVPPGKYILIGHPNPSGDKERTEPITVDLKGGDAQEITLTAKPIAPPIQQAKPVKPVKPPTTNDTF